MRERYIRRWRQFWLSRGGYDLRGRIAAWLGSVGIGCHRQLHSLVWIAPERGFIAPSARIVGVDLRCGSRVFVGERVIIAGWRAKDGDAKPGLVTLANSVQINRECVLELFAGGRISFGEQVGIQMRCHFEAAVHPIDIGDRAMIAPYCVFTSGERRLTGQAPARQEWQSSGPVVIGRDTWLGVGVKVISGVTIGEGAVIAAGSVVMSDIPAGVIAAGNPARVIRLRADLTEAATSSAVNAGGSVVGQAVTGAPQ